MPVALRRAFLLQCSLSVNYLKHIATLAALCLLVASAHGQVLVDDLLVNSDGGRTDQTNPRVAVAGDGSFVVCWVDRRSGQNDIYLQRFESDGTRIGLNERINDDGLGVYQADPAIACDGRDAFTLAWRDYRDGSYPFGPNVYLQHLDSTLAGVGANYNLTSTAPDSLKEAPDLALSSDGNGVVVWADYRNRAWDIFGQRIDNLGHRVGDNFRVNVSTGAQQHAPRVAMSAEGWFVVVWYSNLTGDDDIMCQVYRADGTPIGTNFQINSDGAARRQAFPDVATDGRGRFTVVWVDWRNGTYPANPDIFSRKYDTNLVAVSPERRINGDGTSTAQREVSIAADRRGNVAIVWADSTPYATTWNIVGQMIDVDGVVRETNFEANSELDSAQQSPDVALDGRNRYVTWVDRRNGNYDIFVSVVQYNEPSIEASASQLNFTMLENGTLPVSQQIELEHVGYNALQYEVHSSDSWLNVSPSSGTTPGVVTVSITDNLLAVGDYWSELAVQEAGATDTAAVVLVHLSVTTPTLSVSTDTVHIDAFAGIDVDFSAPFTVSNSGGGDLYWSVTSDANWLQVSPESGMNSHAVEVTVNGLDLTSGVFTEPVVVEAGNAPNSPDTVWVVIEAQDDVPYLSVTPGRLFVATDDPVSVDTFVVVQNLGVETLTWSAAASDDWLSLSLTEGGANDTVWISFDNLDVLGQRLFGGSLTFSAPGAFNETVTVPVSVDVAGQPVDTLTVGSGSVEVDEITAVPIGLHLQDTVASLACTFEVNLGAASIDSVILTAEFVDRVTLTWSSDSAAGLGYLSLQVLDIEALAGPAVVEIADFYITGLVDEQLVDIKAAGDTLSPHVVTVQGDRRQLVVLPGAVQVGLPTDVEDEVPIELPTTFTLHQNYPNPFNLSTTIEFELGTVASAHLDVFNILGQKVAELLDSHVAAGQHRVNWNGRLADGKIAPSGIYFYRLEADGNSLVRKMVLVK